MSTNDAVEKTSKKDLFIKWIGVLMSLTALVQLTGIVTIDLWSYEAVLLLFVFSLAYLPELLHEWHCWKKTIPNLFFYLCGVLPCVYLLFEIPRLEWAYGSEWTNGDIVFGAMMIVAILKLVHRRYGYAMALIALTFIAYVLFGHYLPREFLGHRKFAFDRMVSYMFGPSAIFGTVISTFSRIIILYMLFGSFLNASGVGTYLTDFSLAAAGGFRGGPAKVAVISSALLGTINGNSVANVVTTGSITIPLMKSVGYEPHFAGAVEAVASTGGQILPPVMGAGAFIMAEFLQLSYSDIVAAAAIPACLYFFAVFMMVDLEAVRLRLKGIPADQRPSLKEVLKKIYLLAPIVLLVVELLVVKASVTRSGLLAIGCCVVISFFNKESRMGPKKIFDALYDGAKGCIGIAATCSTAGIIIGAVSVTGLGTRFSSAVLGLAQGNFAVIAILTALICMVLGMGLPTTASYIIAVAVAAPTLIKSGIAPLSAHMFVFYYAILAAITPPVAGASYAAASIAEAPIMKTGYTAVKLGILAYVIPFFFVRNDLLLANGTFTEVLRALSTALVAVVLLSVVLENTTYSGRKPHLLVRLCYLIAFFALLDAGAATDLIGLCCAVVGLALGYFLNRTTERS